MPPWICHVADLEASFVRVSRPHSLVLQVKQREWEDVHCYGSKRGWGSECGQQMRSQTDLCSSSKDDDMYILVVIDSQVTCG